MMSFLCIIQQRVVVNGVTYDCALIFVCCPSGPCHWSVLVSLYRTNDIPTEMAKAKFSKEKCSSACKYLYNVIEGLARWPI